MIDCFLFTMVQMLVTTCLLASFPVLHALFVMQATIAVVEDWERGYMPGPADAYMLSSTY